MKNWGIEFSAWFCEINQETETHANAQMLDRSIYDMGCSAILFFHIIFPEEKIKNCAWLEKAVQQEPGIHGLFFFSTSDMPSEIPNPFREQDTFLQCHVFAQGFFFFFSMYVQINCISMGVGVSTWKSITLRSCITWIIIRRLDSKKLP